MANELRQIALASKAWPFEEARKLLARHPGGSAAAPILFETGYGPSGLPHIGTFNEVLRTTFVRHAFQALSDLPTRLIAFSDDLDGLRKVPDNVPNQAMLHEHLGRPLTRIPDPFGTHPSFADHNNAMLRDFLDRYGFDYEFLSATACYTGGRFDAALRTVLHAHDRIMAVMLPTLRAERRATYSPVLPIDPKSGVVLQVPIEVLDADAGTIRWTDPNDGEVMTGSALGGAAKLQWKVDWAMRWAALGVDYEMAGKDLIDSVVQSSKICRILGARPPEGFNYEMFLDEKGEKISKSKGNGLTIEQWLGYGPKESLAYFIYREPKRAKQLHAGVIPRAIDDYWKSVADYPGQDQAQRLGNPVHHIHNGPPPQQPAPIGFSLLLNLVGVLGANATEDAVWRYLEAYDRGTTAEAFPQLVPLVRYALAYHRDHVAPALARRAPAGIEIEALAALDAHLAGFAPDEDVAAAAQNAVYEVGKHYYGQERLRDWFKALYETLLGSEQGPRMGSFIALYGLAGSRQLIAAALATAAR